MALNVNFKVSGGSATFSLDLEPTVTILAVKALIQEAQEMLKDCSPEQMKLIFKGRILKDSETLASSNVESGQSVHVVKGTKPVTVSNNVPPAATPTPAAAPSGGDPMAALMAGMGNLNMGGAGAGGGDPLAAMMAQGLQPGDAGFDGNAINQAMQDPMISGMVQNQIQEMMNNPQMMQQMWQSNPMIQQMMQNNPQMQQLVNNPEMMAQMQQMMSNPNMMQAMAGGMPGMPGANPAAAAGGYGGQAPPAVPQSMQEMLAHHQQMMVTNPGAQQMMQNLSQNPAMLQQLIQNNPMAQQMMQNNPELAAALNDPQRLQEVTRMMANPGAGGMGGMPGIPGIAGMPAPADPTTSANPGAEADPAAALQNPQFQQNAQNLFSNPAAMNQMIQNNPMVQNMVNANPGMQQMLNNPGFMQFASQMMSNPQMMANLQGTANGMGGMPGGMAGMPGVGGAAAPMVPPAAATPGRCSTDGCDNFESGKGDGLCNACRRKAGETAAVCPPATQPPAGDESATQPPP